MPTPGKDVPPFPHKMSTAGVPSDRGHTYPQRDVSSTPGAPGGLWYEQDNPVRHDAPSTTDGFHPSSRNSNAGKRGHDLSRG